MPGKNNSPKKKRKQGGKGRDREKQPKVTGAEITDDGCIIVEFNYKLYPHTSKAIFEPEALLALAQEHGEIPKASETDFPGIPLVTEASVFDEEEG